MVKLLDRSLPKVDLEVPKIDVDLPDLIPDVDVPSMIGGATDWGGDVVGTTLDVGGSVGGFFENVFTQPAQIASTLSQGAQGMFGQFSEMASPLTGGLGGMLKNPMLLVVLGGAVLVVLMIMMG